MLDTKKNDELNYLNGIYEYENKVNFHLRIFLVNDYIKDLFRHILSLTFD